MLFTLSANQVVTRIETDEAVYIVKCGKHTPPRRVSFEEAQAKIIDKVKDEQFTQLAQQHIQGLMEKATIRPLPEFGRRPSPRPPRSQGPGIPGPRHPANR